MLQKLNKDHITIFKNFSYLTIMKVLNIGIKVILAAYLIRILGNEKYGLLTWLDSVIQYFIMIVNFGFNIYAAKYIVENRNKENNINEIVSSIFIIKTLLFILSLICIVALGQFETFSLYNHILLLFMFSGLGEVLFPIWFFQGVEDLKPATIIVFISRLFLLLGTIFFVEETSNISTYIFFVVVSSALMGLFGFYFLLKKYQIKLEIIPYSKLKIYFKESLPFFVGRFLSLVFNFGTIFFIGKFCELDQVAGFDASLKIVMLGVIPFEMLQQAVFPTISRTKNKNMLKKIVYAALLIGTIIGVGIYFLSDYLMLLIGGDEIVKYTIVLQFMSLLAPFVALTFILGTCSLVAFGFYKEYNFSLIFTSIIYILVLLLLYLFDELTFWNLIYLRVFGDVLMCFIRLYFSLRKKTFVMFKLN